MTFQMSREMSHDSEGQEELPARSEFIERSHRKHSAAEPVIQESHDVVGSEIERLADRQR